MQGGGLVAKERARAQRQGRCRAGCDVATETLTLTPSGHALGSVSVPTPSFLHAPPQPPRCFHPPLMSTCWRCWRWGGGWRASCSACYQSRASKLRTGGGGGGAADGQANTVRAGEGTPLVSMQSLTIRARITTHAPEQNCPLHDMHMAVARRARDGALAGPAI